MNAWEYLIVALPPLESAHSATDHSVDLLNREGAAGWEAVGITTLPDRSVSVLLKRHSHHEQEARRGRPGRAPS